MHDVEKMKKEIGGKIKEKREEMNLSQEQLAEILGYKSKTSIHKVEQGMTDLPQSKIIEFAKALNTSPAYLMGLEIPVNMQINEIIKKRRKELGLTLKQVAEQLGVSESLISRYESKDVKNMGIDKIAPLAEILKCTPAYLMGWEVPEEIPNSIPEVEFMSIPLYASVSAGYGSCQSEFIKMIAIPGLKPNGTTYFAVKVKGDSMEPKIPDNSTVIIKKDIAIENGDIGAFYYNGESYVKQKRINNGKLILHSFNLAYESILVQPYDDFKEYGKVVKVLIDL